VPTAVQAIGRIIAPHGADDVAISTFSNHR
jgi:hypothetical protein